MTMQMARPERQESQPTSSSFFQGLTAPSPNSSELRSLRCAGALIVFRDFQLWPYARKLLSRGASVEIGSRAFDLLLNLVHSRGRLISKDEIVKSVWPTTYVEESNLRFQVASLRRVLGKDADLIKTIPGRGYIFIDEREIDSAAAPSASAGLHKPNGGGESDPGLRDSQPLRTTTVSKPARAPLIGVIDPDSRVRKEVGGLLEKNDMFVRTFESIEAFATGKAASYFDCLIVELWLPGQSGIDFLRELTQADYRVPVVFLSDQADVHVTVQAMKLGANNLLLKPARPLELLEAVREAVRSGPSVRRPPSRN